MPGLLWWYGFNGFVFQVMVSLCSCVFQVVCSQSILILMSLEKFGQCGFGSIRVLISSTYLSICTFEQMGSDRKSTALIWVVFSLA